MFGTKKSQTQPEPVETIAAQEHKQSIGNQVMEALGVGENGTGLDEESEILMPKQNQRQLEAEGVVKESVCVISKDAVIGGGIDVKGDLMVAAYLCIDCDLRWGNQLHRRECDLQQASDARR